MIDSERRSAAHLWPGLGSPRLRLALLIIGVWAVAAACSIVEPPGPPRIQTDLASTFTLSADEPVAVRTIRFTVAPGDHDVRSVDGYVEVVGEGGGGPGGLGHPDVWVSILNTKTGHSADRPEGIGHASVDGWGHSAPCDGESAIRDGEDGRTVSPPCTGSWTVIARWLDPKPNATTALELNANLSATVYDAPWNTPTPKLDEFRIQAEDEPAVSGQPAVSRGVIRGSAIVTTGFFETHDLRLHVPAALLTQDPGFPRLGRLFIGSTVTNWTGPPAHAVIEATIGDRPVGGWGGEGGEVDWLSLCDPGRDCDLDIDMEIKPKVSASAYDATAAPDGSMSIDWIVDARLEDFGADASLPAQIELTQVR